VIGVTRLDGCALVINVDLILSIEQTPDTVIGFANGDKLLVRESPGELMDRVLEYRRRFKVPACVASGSGEHHGA
jgi:flagellar protein FlbD